VETEAVDSSDLFVAPLEKVRAAAPIALATVRWIAEHPAETIRGLETRLATEGGSWAVPPCRLDDAQFPWHRLGVEGDESRTYWELTGRGRRPTTVESEQWSCKIAKLPLLERVKLALPPNTRDVVVVEFFAGGCFVGEIVLDGTVTRGDAEYRPLIEWSEYVLELGTSAIAGLDGKTLPTFPEPNRGLSPKAAAVREILMDAWPEALTAPKLLDELDKRGLYETAAHISDRIVPELEKAGCPIANDGRGYYLKKT
jgi:hypothetical protein